MEVGELSLSLSRVFKVFFKFTWFNTMDNLKVGYSLGNKKEV